ncbi:FeoB-associated Cys-rich membrane protein [Anaerofustis stercorihominis]|uniref:FeoB-associated Cys-rich membrane protein n=1 Tax=Anaerofustis stercorihominis TaxID=214853 RepID=UPI00214B486E|nr:FeoB-associated Cys-rich membrane protein [Anaerofustis stercorihominis]MCR2033567.1 FeoB-associated Cys-rich membrane protein [Anaerofustis stercorihominis]
MNLSSYIILGIILILFILALKKVIRNSGKCSCGCEDCPSRGVCHDEKKNEKTDGH